MKLIIVRHGETHSNRAKLFEGSGNRGGSPLTEDGKIQARLLAKHLSRLFSVDCIYSSPSLRTRDTSTILMEKLNSALVIADELREIDCGQWEDRPIDFIKQANIEQWSIWKERPTEFCFPQGESLGDVKNRITPFINNLLSKSRQQTIVLVSHSAAITVILAYLHNWELEKAWLDRRSYHQNTAFSVLEISADTTTVQSSDVASIVHLGVF